jgi:hypothetical protein
LKISLLTDAPKHNLALMQISAWHKANGDDVSLNMPLFPADYTYASILYDWNIRQFNADEYGGPAYVSMGRFPAAKTDIVSEFLPTDVRTFGPDYDLFGLGYSLGYSFRPCYNTCDFCSVPMMTHPDNLHHSIHEFHDSRFDKICLLNNNTFQDPQWKETFEEIWDANLSVIDENGYDLRLLDDEKADALHRTKWATPIHFAWDRMSDEALIINGLKLVEKHKMRSTSNGVYVLIGYNTTEEEDLHRCQIINDYGLTPYPMPYEKNRYTRRFKRFINLHYYRKYKTISAAWNDYQRAA